MATRRPPIQRRLGFQATPEQKRNREIRRRLGNNLSWLGFDSTEAFLYDFNAPNGAFQGMSDATNDPADTAGDVVGFVVDQLQDPWAFWESAPELVVDGDFSTASDLSAWTDESVGTGSVTLSGGSLVITNADTSNYGKITQTFNCEANAWYMIELTPDATTTQNLYMSCLASGPSCSANVSITSLSGRVYYAWCRPGVNTTMTINFQIPGNAAGTAKIKKVRIRKFPGNHAYQNTTAKKPTLQSDGKGRLVCDFDSVDDGFEVLRDGVVNTKWGFADEPWGFAFADVPNSNGINTLMVHSDTDIGGWALAAQSGAGSAAGAAKTPITFYSAYPGRTAVEGGTDMPSGTLRSEFWGYIQTEAPGAWIVQAGGLNTTNYTNDDKLGLNLYSSWTYNQTYAMMSWRGTTLTQDQAAAILTYMNVQAGNAWA